MSLPAALTLVPVATRTYVDRTGTVMAGKRITAELVTEVSVGLTTIVPKRIKITLDGDGKIPAGTTLPSTNDPDLDLQGLAYTITEKWTGGRTGLLVVPHDATDVDLADLVDTVPAITDAIEQRVATLAAEAVQAAEDAGNSEDAAAASETAAAASAGAAGASATAAAASAASTSADAATATTKAGQASASAAAASTSEGNAAASAAAAAASATASDTARAASVAAKTAAEAAQAAASGSATAASGSATAAAGSAAAAAAAAAVLGSWQQITQAAYDALTPPDDNTLYVIVG